MDKALQTDSERFFIRLAQPIPTVWVLIGPKDAIVNEWKKVVEQRRLRYTIVQEAETEILSGVWSKNWLIFNNLLEKSAEYAAALSALPIVNTFEWMQNKSAEERRLFVENHFAHRQQTPLIKVAQAVLLHWEALVTQSNPLTQQQNFLDAVLDDPIQRIRALFLLAPTHSPALLVVSDDDIVEEKQYSCVIQAAKIAMEVPTLPLAWGVSQRRYEAFLNGTPESKEKTICREMVSVISSSGNKEEPDLPILSERQSETLTLLKRSGASPSLLERFKETVRALQSPGHGGSPGVEQARSAAEAFLFERLETLPETQGLFHLNRKLSIDCAEWPVLEIDLYCEPLRIAIEVDGYYHFQDRDAYRRDRRKDYLMQRGKCFVLRFHAEDIVEYLETILKTIVETIDLLKRQNMKV